MRPVKLTMQAFGPYADKTIVDMEELGGKGLYLITGDTGAGKTTIFDGVCYSLFGKTSGNVRDIKMMRSKYAAPEVPSYVELEFKYGSTVYTVTRQQKQTMTTPDGKNKKIADQIFRLYRNEGETETFSNEKDLNKRIIELLGLTCEQYHSVAMIAQGSFAQMLNSTTDERTEILGRIFSTGNYSKLQEELKKDAEKIDELCCETKSKMCTMLEHIKLSSDDPYTEEIAAAAVSVDSIAAVKDSITEVCENALEHERQKAATADRAFTQADKNRKEAQLALQKGKDADELFIRLKQTEDMLAKLIPDLSEAEKRAKEMHGRKPELDKLIGQIAAETEQLKKYDDAETQLKEAEVLAKKAAAAAQISEQLRSELSRNSKNTEQLKALITDLGDVGAKLAQTKGVLEKHSIELKMITEIGTEFSKADELKVQKLRSAAELKSVKSDHDKAADEHRMLFDAYIADQAGMLAEELTEGSACPVCGSTAHPYKAQRAVNAPDKRTVEAAKVRLEKLQDETEKAARKLSADEAAYETTLASAMKRAGKYAEGCTPEQALANAREDFKKIRAAQKKADAERIELEQKVAMRSKAEQELEQLAKKITEGNSRLNELQGELSKYKATSEEKMSSAKKLLAELPCSSKAEASKQIYQLTAKRDELEKAMKAADERFAALEKQVTELTGKAGTLKEQTKDMQKPDLAALNEKLKTAENAVKQALELRESAKVCMSSAEETLNGIKASLVRLNKQEAEFSMIDELNKTANGAINDSQRISLETFVQIEYFDRILAHANSRLMQMTSSQYELVRSNSKRGRARIGLELNVIDYFSCSERSTKSLSGGESFMASLALALGFSDEIQQTSGGVRIDSMFVDEGFGSLDDESLDKAVQTLNELAENSRLVGIISHVPELKEKLEKQIIVEKDRTAGSRVRIVT